MKRLRRNDGGFTLVELVMTVTILGIIMIPLGNFVLEYFQNYPQTENRIADSHDMQIAAAYLSNDVASAGLHSSYTSAATSQSVWATGFPASYCGSGAGTTVLLLSWNTWTIAQSGGGSFGPTSSVAYVNESGALHRIYCASGTTTSSDATLVDGLQSASVACSVACSASPPPATVSLTLNISTGSDDTAATSVVLTGQRRQS
ncbi:MAG TPA: prepilin-type N-terminal cleavage/methylation domain-containing protein [Jatrophihabitans sp.]|jgi:prepilin-type N-terminal cleavage/methylation domain-containing protein